MDRRPTCSTCGSTGLMLVAIKDGYSVYKQCPDCRRKEAADDPA